MVTGQALLCVIKQHEGVPSMWPDDVIQHMLHVNYDDICMELKGRVALRQDDYRGPICWSLCKQSYSSMSDEGTAHNTY